MTPFLRLAPALLVALVCGCNFGSSSPAADGGSESSIGSPSGLVASPSSESFGTVAVGATSAPANVTFSNSGPGATGVLASTVTGADAAAFAVASDGCSGKSLGVGETCEVKVQFAPHAAGAQQADLTVADQHGTVAVVALTGDGASASPGSLSVAPTTQDFGMLASGSKSAAVPFAFANHGGTATPPLAVSLTGPDASDFQLADPCSGKPLAAGASCQVTVTFAPAATGSKTASLAGTAQGLGTATASLSGAAAPGAAFAVTPGTYDFGSILVGTPTATQTFTVTNGGGVASGVPAVAITGANAADFVVSANQCTSALAGGAKCTFAVAFTPASPAAESATVTVSGAATASGTAALTGTGLAPAAIGLSPTSEAFGSWPQTQSSPATTFTLTNSGGVATGALAVSLGGTNKTQFAIDSDSCTGAMLAATTGTCAIAVHFAPTAGTVGSVQATLDVTGSPGGSTAATLTGIALAPAMLTISPTSEPFGTWPWNVASPSQSFTVTNVGEVASGTLSASFGGTDPQDFAKGSDTCTGHALAPNATCTLSAWFSPQGLPLGALSATLDVGDGTASASAALSATSVEAAALTITAPTGFTGFGPVLLLSTSTATFTVTNGGGVVSGSITMSLSGSAEYTLMSDTCTGNTLGPAATCTVGVQFKPTAAGAAPGQLGLTATPGGPATFALTGTGVTQAALAITAPTGFAGFGAQQAGTAGSPVAYTITNTGGVTAGAIGDGLGSLSPSGDFGIVSDACIGMQLAAGASCQITVHFTPPAGTTGTETASLQANASPGGAPSIVLGGTSYTPAVLTMQPPSGFGGFGSVALGGSSTYVFTLTNSGTQQAGTPSITTTNALFTVSSLGTCTGPITTSCTFDVTFTPAAPPGTDSVTINATSSPGGTASYGPTTGTGTAAVLVLNANSWDTTLAACGTTGFNFSVTNTGNVATTSPISVTFSGAQSGAFSSGSYICTGDLQPNVPCTIPVTFACPAADPLGYEGIGTLSITAGGTTGGAATASLDVGAGVAVSPNPATFGGAIAPGTSVTEQFTVKNFTGVTTKQIIGYTLGGSDPGDYTATDISCVNNTLPANGSCSFQVKYSAPVGALGTDAATLAVNYTQVCTFSCGPFTLATTTLDGSEN
jgi:hypothetical protein